MRTQVTHTHTHTHTHTQDGGLKNFTAAYAYAAMAVTAAMRGFLQRQAIMAELVKVSWGASLQFDDCGLISCHVQIRAIKYACA